MTVRYVLEQAPEALQAAYHRACSVASQMTYDDVRYNIAKRGSYEHVFDEHFHKLLVPFGGRFQQFCRRNDRLDGLVWEKCAFVFPSDDEMMQFILSV